MSNDTKPLSLRHERFVAEYLKDSNATRAYLRAGYSPRGAQPSASRLLRRPDIAAAIAAGRQRITQALEVSVERLAQEYAKIAFASVDDFITVGDDGTVRVDLEKASQAQRAGIVELRVSTNHSKREQRVTLKLGKLQALAALTQYAPLLVPKPKPDLTAGERQRYEEKCEQLARELDDSIDEQWHLEQELDALRKAQAEARTAQEDVTPVAAAAAAAPPPSPPPAPADTAQEPPPTAQAQSAPVDPPVRQPDAWLPRLRQSAQWPPRWDEGPAA